MSMSIGGGGEDEPMMEMNMTPLIDVLLVLLVMFIITIPVMTHAVKLDMPRATNAPSQVLPVVINLEIDFDGTILWNGTPVPAVFDPGALVFPTTPMGTTSASQEITIGNADMHASLTISSLMFMISIAATAWQAPGTI